MRGFLLDINIFNHLLEGKIHIEDIPFDLPTFVTTIHYDEILQCKDLEKKSALYSYLKILPQHELPLSTLVAGIGRAGSACVGDGVLYLKLLQELNKKKKKIMPMYMMPLLAKLQ